MCGVERAVERLRPPVRGRPRAPETWWTDGPAPGQASAPAEQAGQPIGPARARAGSGFHGRLGIARPPRLEARSYAEGPLCPTPASACPRAAKFAVARPAVSSGFYLLSGYDCFIVVAVRLVARVTKA